MKFIQKMGLIAVLGFWAWLCGPSHASALHGGPLESSPVLTQVWVALPEEAKPTLVQEILTFSAETITPTVLNLRVWGLNAWSDWLRLTVEAAARLRDSGTQAHSARLAQAQRSRMQSRPESQRPERRYVFSSNKSNKYLGIKA